MNYNKSNAAYDLSRFAPAQENEQQQPQKVKKPAVRKHVLKAKPLKPAVVVKWVFISLFVMMSLTAIMVGNIRITQMSDQIASTQKALDSAKSDQVTLNSKLESRMSMSKVEDYAVNKLGLVKIKSYQIQYVNLTNKDKVAVNSNGSGIEAFFKNIANTIMEYFE